MYHRDSLTSASPALNSTANNQSDTVGGRSGNNAADEIDAKCAHVGPLSGQVLVHLAPHGRGHADGKETGGAVPSNVVESVKLLSDFGDCGSDNAL